MRFAFAAALPSIALAALIPPALGQTPASQPPATRTTGDRPVGDAAKGRALFLDNCAICHVAEGGGQGPSLNGIYGRRAASAPGFAYSAALKASGVTWTGPQLDHFLTNPNAAIPGTAMPFTVPDAQQRADVIAYLAAQP